ncbi:MAG: hypothetical protein MO852_17315, partial [Candidatus Devosia euplotis]|nr:hypothetical protein [Candidatus Devosia euplotis]
AANMTELLWAAEETMACRAVAAVVADIADHQKTARFHRQPPARPAQRQRWRLHAAAALWRRTRGQRRPFALAHHPGAERGQAL